MFDFLGAKLLLFSDLCNAQKWGILPLGTNRKLPTPGRREFAEKPGMLIPDGATTRGMTGGLGNAVARFGVDANRSGNHICRHTYQRDARCIKIFLCHNLTNFRV